MACSVCRTWKFDPSAVTSKQQPPETAACSWLHPDAAAPPLNDAAATYLASCDAYRVPSDAAVLSCLLTRDAVCRPTAKFGDGDMLPLVRTLVRVGHLRELDLSYTKKAACVPLGLSRPISVCGSLVVRSILLSRPSRTPQKRPRVRGTFSSPRRRRARVDR